VLLGQRERLPFRLGDEAERLPTGEVVAHPGGGRKSEGT
jgi:hypothetical protein